MSLLVVSNRLPFNVTERNGKIKLQPSVGGLVSGISAYLDYLKSSHSKEYIWVGWPGRNIDDKLQQELKLHAISEFSSYPVFIPEKSMEKFYHGFCNKTIWPLFHYFPTYAVYDEDYWAHYKSVNEIFCKAIMEFIKPMGIDFNRFHNAGATPEVEKEKAKLNKVLSNFKVILSIDRLDYTKGIFNRLLGYEAFLEKNHRWHKRLVF